LTITTRKIALVKPLYVIVFFFIKIHRVDASIKIHGKINKNYSLTQIKPAIIKSLKKLLMGLSQKNADDTDNADFHR